jgi:hypothetical protein
VGQRVAAILRRSSTISFSGMVTRNGRIAVSSFSAAAGVDESVEDVIVAMAMTPILIARQVSRSSDFMLFSSTT